MAIAMRAHVRKESCDLLPLSHLARDGKIGTIYVLKEAKKLKGYLSGQGPAMADEE